MPSISSKAVRARPQQERSTRRLASFLAAAAALFGEAGYEATTMTAIAERNGSSIGALYNYFPDKESIALSLIQQYSAELQEFWTPLLEQAATLAPTKFAELLIESVLQFTQERPAFLALLDEPVRRRRDKTARKKIRTTAATAYRTKNPALTEEQALLAANVSFQLVKGMVALLGETEPRHRPALVAEFKKALALYLEAVLTPPLPGRK